VRALGPLRMSVRTCIQRLHTESQRLHTESQCFKWAAMCRNSVPGSQRIVTFWFGAPKVIKFLPECWSVPAGMLFWGLESQERVGDQSVI